MLIREFSVPSSHYMVELPAFAVPDAMLVWYERGDTTNPFLLRRSLMWGANLINAAPGTVMLTPVEKFKHSLEKAQFNYRDGLGQANNTLIVADNTRLKLAFEDANSLIKCLRELRVPDPATADEHRPRAHAWEEINPKQYAMSWRCKQCGMRTNEISDPQLNDCDGSELA